MAMQEGQVRRFLEGYARALSSADVRWDHPAPDGGGSLGGEHAFYVVSAGPDGRLGIDLCSPGD